MAIVTRIWFKNRDQIDSAATGDGDWGDPDPSGKTVLGGTAVGTAEVKFKRRADGTTPDPQPHTNLKPGSYIAPIGDWLVVVEKKEVA